MVFPVPSVAGVFLSLSNRLETAVTDGSAAHYLLGRTPTRLRNHLGFHAALAEMADALLERAVLPYQITPSLSSLTVLPTAQLSGTDVLPVQVEAKTGLPAPLATAAKRARLGTEKRYAPLEFWRAILDGINSLSSSQNVFLWPRNAASEDYADVVIYPPLVCPTAVDPGDAAFDEHLSYGCKFADVFDTGWWYGTFPWYEQSANGLSVQMSLLFHHLSTDWESQAMLIHLMYEPSGGGGPEPGPYDNFDTAFSFTSGRWVEGTSFDKTSLLRGLFPAMKEAMYELYDWAPQEGTPKPTARPNLDLLRIYQILLGCFWANWARMPVVIEVPHIEETVRRTWHVDEYGDVGEPYDTPVSSKTCSQLSVDQECQWRLSLDPDSEYSRCYGCRGQFYYEIPFWWHSHEESESAVESYPYLDGLDADGVGIGRAEVQRIVDDARARKQRAEQDKAAAEQAKVAAELYLSGGGVADLAASLAAAMQGGSYWTDGSTARYRRPDDHVWVFDCGFDLMVDDQVWMGGLTQVADVFRAPNPDDDSIPGEFLLQESAQSLFSSAVGHAGTGQPPPSGSFSIRVRGSSPVLNIGAQGIGDALRSRHQAGQDIADAEARIAAESETVEFGVKVDIGPELFRRILSRHDDLLETWVADDCDTDSGNLLVAGMRWLAAHGDLSGWEPRDPQGGFDYSETAYRRVPVLDSESCPVRVYLAHLLAEGVSPWPAESVVDAEYVKAETVALGMAMLDEARGAHEESGGGIGFDYGPDDPEPLCRRLAVSGASEPGVSAPAETVRGILSALVAAFPDLPTRAASAVRNGRFDRLLFAEPQIGGGGAPDFGWNVRPAYAWYHPDRGPDMTGQYQWLDPGKLWPYRVTSEQSDGTVSECSLENGDGFLLYLVVDAYFEWCPLIVTPAPGFHDQMTLHLSEHVAVRAEWDWKSMPVEHS